MFTPMADVHLFSRVSVFSYLFANLDFEMYELLELLNSIDPDVVD